jgi:hypothetical protein
VFLCFLQLIHPTFNSSLPASTTSWSNSHDKSSHRYCRDHRRSWA